MYFKSQKQEIAQSIERNFPFKVSVARKYIGNSFHLVITLPKETDEQTIEAIAELLDDEGWSYILRRDGDKD